MSIKADRLINYDILNRMFIRDLDNYIKFVRLISSKGKIKIIQSVKKTDTKQNKTNIGLRKLF